MEIPPQPFLNVPGHPRLVTGHQPLDTVVCSLQHRPAVAVPAAEIEDVIPEELI